MATHSPKSMPFIKNLASSDRKRRTESLSALRSFLSARRTSSHEFTYLDAFKLWKGLFYALWMCDRPLPQQALCDELSALHMLLSPSSVPTWWRAFWAVMASEWTTGIDVLRMNKFLLLVRRIVYAILSFPRDRRGWEAGSVLDTIGVLEEGPFEVTGDLRKTPIGLRLHVLDTWIDEIDRAGILDAATSGDQEALKFVKKVSEAVEKLEKCPCKPVRERAKDCCEDERLPWNRGTGRTVLGEGDNSNGNDCSLTSDNWVPPDEAEGSDGWSGFDD